MADEHGVTSPKQFAYSAGKPPLGFKAREYSSVALGFALLVSILPCMLSIPFFGLSFFFKYQNQRHSFP